MKLGRLSEWGAGQNILDVAARPFKQKTRH